MKRVTLLFPLASVLAFVGCSRHGNSAAVATTTLPAARVHLVTVKTENVPQRTEVTGLVRPVNHAQLAAKVMGTIEEMPVTLGQSVHKGDLLVKISAGEIVARVAQAQSQLNAARRDLDREQELLKKGASTADMVRGLEDRYTASAAMVREAETMLAYTQIRAPFDGAIARKNANAGDLAAPGSPLLEVEGTTDFQVEAGIPDSLAGTLKPGASLEVDIPAAGQHFFGELAEISPAADGSALTVLAKIAVPAGAVVRSGQFARVQVPGASVPALLAPISAVTQLGQMQRVFVAGDGNRAVLRLVRTGATRDDRVEITAGIDNNERIVVAPPTGLTEGQLLEVLP